MSVIGNIGDMPPDYMIIDIPDDEIQHLSHAQLIALIREQSQNFRTAMERERSPHGSELETPSEDDCLRRSDVRPRSHSEVPDERERDRHRERHRPINVSCIDKMAGDISYRDFLTWRNKWDDFCYLQRIAEYPIREQAAALRMTLSLEMLQTVEMVLDISPYDLLSADEILAQIARYIRKKRSVALDRVEFEEYRQDHGATFDEFYIGLQRIAKCADLCRHCLDQRMTTRVMSGICDQDVRKKLLAITPFPSLQTAVDLCRSEEAAGKK